MGINCSLKQNQKSPECKTIPRPLISYFGGKQRVADKIISKFPDHKTYVEPFVGGGSIFWKNTMPDKFVINDLDKNIYHLYKSAQTGNPSLKSCDMNHMNRSKFKTIKNKPKKSACDIMNIYKHSFMSGGGSYADKGAKKFNNPYSQTHKDKMKKTVVLNKDFASVAKQYDKKGVVQYWDPPYVKEGGAYATHGVTAQQVCDVAKQIKSAKVVISYDNHPNVRKACKKLKLHTLTVPYSGLNIGKYAYQKRSGKELLVTNY